MPTASKSPYTKPTAAYQSTIAALTSADARTEGHYRRAFSQLLTSAAHAAKTPWTLIEEFTLKTSGGNSIRWDGVFKDPLGLRRGYWEAKDTADDLPVEIAAKRAKGYTLENSIFEDTRTAYLFQDGREVLRIDLTDAAAIGRLLDKFFTYTEPDIVEFERAVAEFQQRVPELAAELKAKIADGHAKNPKFQAAHAAFMDVCRAALDPAIRRDTVDEMLVQHLLTERLIRKIFDNPDFRTQNVIANEIERVIAALVSASFSREDYLKGLNRFYAAIEKAADTLTEFSDKQAFLNTVYEKFFQSYAVDVADTHGIVYTPQPIVDFMCASVIDVLATDFNKTLGDPDVVILDPCTGTGNFIVNLLRRAPGSQRRSLYESRLFANEIMLLPYYVAALNIEHAYYDLTGTYAPFDGLCFVDTLTLAEGQQLSLFSEANTARVRRQKDAPITVIVGNPPYNVGQKNENDNNKNRKYPVIDGRVKATYVKDSTATLKTQVYDPYVKFFRWASDRLEGRDGIVCYVSNNSFVDGLAFDGMRKHLLQDFTRVYHVDLHGNVRQNPQLSGTTHNVFGIQVGVGITLAIKKAADVQRGLFYVRVPEDWKKEQKFDWLIAQQKTSVVPWTPITPNAKHNWRIVSGAAEFAEMMPIGSKEAKGGKSGAEITVFQTYGHGVKTGRDRVVHDFQHQVLKDRVKDFIEFYNSEVDRYKRHNRPSDIDGFVNYNRIKWTRNLKSYLKRGLYAQFDISKIRPSLYRPYSAQYLFFDHLLNDEASILFSVFPKGISRENRMICVSGIGSSKPFMALMTNLVPGLDLLEKTQCFPFYVYDADGTNRRENIPDAALAAFQAVHGAAVTKWDIFHYVYAALHDPVWRGQYADALKKDLPRLPVTPPRGTFVAWAAAGKQLADLHVHYETIAPYPLTRIEQPGVPYTARIEKLRLNSAKTELTVNAALTLTDLPPEAFQYRLGGRSALEWVVDQYAVTRDKSGQIVSDPNRADDPDYILNLIGRVVAVSVQTMAIVAGLG